MAVMGKIAWTDPHWCPSASPVAERLEFPRVFRGRELTRKDRRIPSGLLPIDNLIEGGIVRGRISEIIAEPGAGKTSLAAAFAANVTRNEAAAWIDNSDNFDPASIAAAGVELTRLLWVSSKRAQGAQTEPPPPQVAKSYSSRPPLASLKAAEWILAAGGFGLVVLDFGVNAPHLSQGAVLRLARGAERCGAGVLVLAPRRICGTFAALSLTLKRERACFSRLWAESPTLFEGLKLEARVTRNKLGGSGQTAKWKTVTEAEIGFSADQDSLSRRPHFNASDSPTAPRSLFKRKNTSPQSRQPQQDKHSQL